MSVYSLTPVFEPQAVPNAAGPLAFVGGVTAVQSGYVIQLQVIRVCNIGLSPCSLELWRVPNGSNRDNTHIVVPAINIPVASYTAPWFDLETLWGIVLQPGDAIHAVAGALNTINLHGDGIVVQG